MPLRTAARKCPDATFLPFDPEPRTTRRPKGDGPAARPRSPARGLGLGRGLPRGADGRRPVALAERIRTVIAGETGIVVFGGHQRQQAARQGGHRIRQAGRDLSAHRRELDGGDGRPRRRRLWGVGPKTAKRLAGLGITTVADLAATDASVLTSAFGPTTGLWICCWPRAAATTTSAPNRGWRARAATSSRLPRDLTDRAEIDSAVSRTRAPDADRDRRARPAS